MENPFLTVNRDITREETHKEVLKEEEEETTGHKFVNIDVLKKILEDWWEC